MEKQETRLEPQKWQRATSKADDTAKPADYFGTKTTDRRAEIDKALEELGKVSDTDAVYKHAGSILVKSTKSASTDDLTERRELSKTRIMVMEKQETRLRESLKEQDAKISEMVSGKKDPNSPPPQSKT